MKKVLFALVAAACTWMAPANAALVVTGLVDGPLSGGTPKAVELYSTTASADLAGYTLEYYFNANATPSVTVDFSGVSIGAGEFIYITPNAAEFNTFFGFAPTITGGGSINGDDSVVLNLNGSIVDTFGTPGTDGTGEAWEYLDGWAYRNDDTGPGAFNIAEWTFSGPNALDGEATNAGATTPFPIGTYQITAVPEPSSVACLTLLGCGAVYRRVRRKKVA
ncbi:lamin tail domain-containing protein [Crateriforma conspicua]|uniref:LTD domain-containing protein n=1 Tax=Crateriforma conspicua TaxID=2527996 RepID=A0A5C5YBH3_9PLAN|nr:lamin tail domain-containing protein [Crateriforma conspicua]QDV61283.1 hypothetical protein Mal65_04060 [Crateriforma conspicua]TWT72464.1 hypothetical protein Pan14r_47840 [Crateriforma conspicua]